MKGYNYSDAAMYIGHYTVFIVMFFALFNS